LRIRLVVVVCVAAAALTYFSLLVPGRVSAVCSNIGTPVYCPVIAYGGAIPSLVLSFGWVHAWGEV
jgi:hypothetical protein